MQGQLNKAVLFFSLVVALLLPTACSINIEEEKQLNKLFQSALKKFWQQDADLYRISKFKKLLVIEKTTERYTVLVSYVVRINDDKPIKLQANKSKFKKADRGKMKNLLVFVRDKGKWKLDMQSVIFEASDPKSDLNIKVTLVNGYAEYIYFNRAHPERVAYSVPNKERKHLDSLKIKRKFLPLLVGPEVYPCKMDVRSRVKPKAIRHDNTVPLVVPQGKNVRLLVTSKYHVYSFNDKQPRINVSAMPGYVLPMSVNTEQTGTKHAWFYRNCGDDVVYGRLPVKVLPEKKYRRWLWKQRKKAPQK